MPKGTRDGFSLYGKVGMSSTPWLTGAHNVGASSTILTPHLRISTVLIKDHQRVGRAGSQEDQISKGGSKAYRSGPAPQGGCHHVWNWYRRQKPRMRPRGRTVPGKGWQFSSSWYLSSIDRQQNSTDRAA